MKQVKFWILLVLILVPRGFNFQRLPEEPIQINLFKEFEALKLDIQDPLLFKPMPIVEKAIYRYEPSQKIEIPDNFRLVAKHSEKRQLSVFPYIDSREDKETDELEVFWGLKVNATF